MTDEDFLKRWSRRKRESAEEVKAVPESASVPAETSENAAAKAVPEIEPPFDPATLPPIDSITAVSDISAFLQQGVPADMKRAALRRVWTADPAIRDFIGLAENAWDFTDPNAMHGFGPLESTEEVRRLIADLVDRIGEAAQPMMPDADQDPRALLESSNHSNLIDTFQPEAAGSEPAAAEPAQTVENLSDQVLVQSNKEDSAPHNDVAAETDGSMQSLRRRQGTALPH